MPACPHLLAKHLPLYSLKNVLSLHIFLDYFDAKKLHQITNGTALAATLFQATGSAPGSTGFVNITDLKGGKAGFAPQNSELIDAYFVKGAEGIKYNISIIQISKILPSKVATAPTPGPAAANLTSAMSAHGCKVFTDTLLTIPDAEKMFQDGVDGGMTVFCPVDDVQGVSAEVQEPDGRREEVAARVPRRAGVPIHGDAEVQQRGYEHVGHRRGEEV
ncbi:hypothetical protein FH972_008021 [Carpinus fangiana]|uniref:FAS1 domain-containing protein n=1 Tax=Carpinus fangiana TaxID=176857 RepID=A0A5N6QXC5_9ROSI|nr:hypothetical protein FH972_008021 [Carpinus fangiana]